MLKDNPHAQARLREVDARRTDERVAACMRLVRKNLDMVEPEAHIKLKALVSLAAMFIVTELMHLPWSEVRRQAFKLWRTSLDEMHAKFIEVEKRIEIEERKAND